MRNRNLACSPSVPPSLLFSVCSSHPPSLQGHWPKKAGECSTNTKGRISTPSKSSKKASLLTGEESLSRRLNHIMEKYKEVGHNVFEASVGMGMCWFWL